ncbi:DNA double-strand break repair nuclease NurA [Halococcus sp. PRR34]|uniref:DNA double-strand break repair nuclease NurA n=1 Tax=Halococcus sp. PRR34 TaxID=3020830 RepID=UPI0023628AEF|nr:DNA double-strand break repair nuclease NurA [Halococcus sp. PRR34]
MTGMETYSTFEEMFDELDRAVGEFADQQTTTAADAIAEFTRDGGNVTTLTEEAFAVTHEPTSELAEWDDPWPVTYGIDGSTTRSLRFHNGLIAGASAAKLGVSGESDNTDLARRTTTTLIAYLNADGFSLGGARSAGLDTPEDIDAHLFSFPSCERTNRIEDYVVGVSRTFAEGKHARELADELDGPLFIDGPLYPSPAFQWMLFGQVEGGPRGMAEIWPEMVGDILQNYVSTIETMYENDLPVIGIVKTGRSSVALTALEDKIRNTDIDGLELPLPWSSDTQLFSNALHTEADLYGDRGHLISYTPWLFQTEQTAHGESVIPFGSFDGVSLRYGDPQEYQRAFFYARCPRSGTVMRVETPYMFARNDRFRERIQRKALVELAQQQNEPRAITFADENARITRNDRKNLLNVIQNVAPVAEREVQRGQDRFESE